LLSAGYSSFKFSDKRYTHWPRKLCPYFSSRPLWILATMFCVVRVKGKVKVVPVLN
jgi:hypothetical protein